MRALRPLSAQPARSRGVRAPLVCLVSLAALAIAGEAAATPEPAEDEPAAEQDTSRDDAPIASPPDVPPDPSPEERSQPIVRGALEQTGRDAAVATDNRSEPEQHRPRRRGMIMNGWWLMPGATAGLSLHPDSDVGGIIGGEISMVRFPMGEGFWAGGYADTLYDSARNVGRTSGGIELGYSMIGFDAGPVVEYGDAGTRGGIAIRPIFSFAFIQLYSRFGFFFDDSAKDERFIEFGTLIKVPVPLIDLDGDR